MQRSSARSLMSSNWCYNDSKQCKQSYPVKDYLLALFVIVGFLVSVRILFYATYYLWLRISPWRQQDADLRTDAANGRLPYANLRGPRSTTTTEEDQSVCVIVAGQDTPTFIAQPAPLAPIRNPDPDGEKFHLQKSGAPQD